MPGLFRFLADSPPSTINSTISAPCTTAMARIFASWASSETPWSACLSVETLTYPIAGIVTQHGSVTRKDTSTASLNYRTVGLTTLDMELNPQVRTSSTVFTEQLSIDN